MTVKHERQVLRQARMNREERDYAQRARNAKLAALVTGELMALLERLANDAEYVSTVNDPYRYLAMPDAEEARAIAARIKEILDDTT